MRQDLKHADDKNVLRNFSVHCKLIAKLGITNDDGLAAHAQRVSDAGNDEYQTDIRILKDISEGIEATVAWPIGDSQGLIVQQFDEAWSITFWRDINRAVWASRCNEHEG